METGSAASRSNGMEFGVSESAETGQERGRSGMMTFPGWSSLLGLFGLLGVMVLMVRVARFLVVVVTLDRDPLALSPSCLLLIEEGAQPSPVLLIPGAQWLAAKHEIVVLDDGGHHPRVARQLYLVGQIRDVEVGDQHIGLRGPVGS